MPEQKKFTLFLEKCDAAYVSYWEGVKESYHSINLFSVTNGEIRPRRCCSGTSFFYSSNMYKSNRFIFPIWPDLEAGWFGLIILAAHHKAIVRVFRRKSCNSFMLQKYDEWRVTKFPLYHYVISNRHTCMKNSWYTYHSIVIVQDNLCPSWVSLQQWPLQAVIISLSTTISGPRWQLFFVSNQDNLLCSTTDDWYHTLWLNAHSCIVDQYLKKANLTLFNFRVHYNWDKLGVYCPVLTEVKFLSY